MESSDTYPDLSEPGIRRMGKKKLARTKKNYDNRADDALNEMVSRNTGIDPFRKKRKRGL